MQSVARDSFQATQDLAKAKLDRPDAKTIPIIALTANAFEEDVQNCLAAGINAHISKPVELDRLKELLSGLL